MREGEKTLPGMDSSGWYDLEAESLWQAAKEALATGDKEKGRRLVEESIRAAQTSIVDMFQELQEERSNEFENW